jgi:hypothetical protein
MDPITSVAMEEEDMPYTQKNCPGGKLKLQVVKASVDFKCVF